MDSARTRTYAIIFLALGVLAFGFWVGSLTTGLLLAKRNRNSDLPFSAGRVMSKRMSAIKKAINEGRSEYEFEVSGFHPVLK